MKTSNSYQGKPSKASPWLVLLAMFGPATVVAGLVIAACWWFVHIGRDQELVQTYGIALRASLFAGFLTMGSFLLSLKTGLVIKVKEQVYDDLDYQREVSDGAENGTSLTIYGPLRRLSLALSAAVLSAILAAVAQVTLGLIESALVVSVCLALAAFAIGMLITSFVLIQQTLHAWFDRLEVGAEKKMKNAKAA